MNSTTDSMQILGTEREFREMLSQFQNAEFIKVVSEKANSSFDDVELLLSRYVGEMVHGYRFLESHLPTGKLRILEVGAGLGLLSIYLQRLGHDVVAIEPAGAAFNIFNATKQEICQRVGGQLPVFLDIQAQDLDTAIHGAFDFSFSVNVMEHVEELDIALAQTLSVMTPRGVSAHSCPNYLVPYEPHFAIPLVPLSPKLSRLLFRSKINRDPDLWTTLNFITARRVRHIARDNGCRVSFEPGLLYQAFRRLGDDPEFLSRHEGGLAVTIFKILNRTRLLGLLRAIPAGLATPMEFVIRKNTDEQA